MREWFRVFYAILKDVWDRRSFQSSNAFEKGTCLLAYRVGLNIHVADPMAWWSIERELKHEWARLFLPNTCVPADKSLKALVV